MSTLMMSVDEDSIPYRGTELEKIYDSTYYDGLNEKPSKSFPFLSLQNSYNIEK